MVLKLYAAPASTASLRVALILHEKEVPFEFHPIYLRNKEQKSADFLEKNPFGQVPYIDDEGFGLYESRAIGCYIALKYAGQGTQGLIPPQTDVQATAIFERAASLEHAQFDAHASKIVYERVFHTAMGLPVDEEAVKYAIAQLSAKLDAYETIFSKQTYLAGETVTLADLYHIPWGNLLSRAGEGASDLITSRPSVSRWFEALVARPSWAAVHGGICSTN
ncbi:glutathione S-transferase [Ephemerocybe angulata]|uniref:glutathione transferase n=1 Tax=Ephemerocybe angulata TaxID=980116 RepID=A0A8H6LU63_9AGAR|nr:glutathione S-transferase [Tulosesus angulatus]